MAVFTDRHFVSDFLKNTGQLVNKWPCINVRMTDIDGYTQAGASRKGRDTKNVDLRIPKSSYLGTGKAT